MKNKSLLTTLVILFIIGAFYGWHRHNTPSNTANLHRHNKMENKYICPMHPQITSDHPGTCPICGMDLVLASDLEEEEEVSSSQDNMMDKQNTTNSTPKGRSPIKLLLNKQQKIGVKIKKIEEKNLFKSIKVPGRIAFDPELYTAQSEYLEALKQWQRVKDSPILGVKENTKQMIRSSKIRLKVMGLSDDQITRLTKKGFQSEGLLVGGQDNIVYADVFEMDLPYIKEGQSAQINAHFLQGATLSGKVISVDQVINPETRTAKVRIQLLKKHSSIRPESYVNVTIFAPLGKHISVPLESIFRTGLDTYIFIKKSEDTFEPVSVKVTMETDTDAAILGSVTPGDNVVVGANFLIDSESRLNAVINSNTASPTEHDH